MTLETCKICGTLDKRGTHDECQGMPDKWRECGKCSTYDDLDCHDCVVTK